MIEQGRRGGGGSGPGRALIRAGSACLVVAGCAADPPPALLTVVDVPTLAAQDSRLLPDSAKSEIRSYLGRVNDAVWSDGPDPQFEQLVGETRNVTALLDTMALPRAGRTRAVLVDVPGAGPREFRLTHVTDRRSGRQTYTGQARHDSITILLVRDSAAAGRITTTGGVFNFRSARYGLISIAPMDSSGRLPELHLIGGSVPASGGSHDSCLSGVNDPQDARVAEECLSS